LRGATCDTASPSQRPPCGFVPLPWHLPLYFPAPRGLTRPRTAYGRSTPFRTVARRTRQLDAVAYDYRVSSAASCRRGRACMATRRLVRWPLAHIMRPHPLSVRYLSVSVCGQLLVLRVGSGKIGSAVGLRWSNAAVGHLG